MADSTRASCTHRLRARVPTYLTHACAGAQTTDATHVHTRRTWELPSPPASAEEAATHAAALERLTRPEGPLLETIAKQCADAQLVVELVVAPGKASTFCDVASLAALPALTGGQLRHVPGVAEDNAGGGGGEGMKATLEAAVTAAVLGSGGGGGAGGEAQVVSGHDAVLRLRASTGLRPRHVVRPSGGDEASAASGVIALPLVDRHHSFALELSHDPKVRP